MSHTITRSRRFSRLAAGLTVAAAATATTLLGASPAYAQSNAVTAKMFGSSLYVTGTAFGDSVSATNASGAVRLSSLLGPITAGQGCVQLGAAVQCSGVSQIRYFGKDGDDTVRNDTAVRLAAFGGNGTDRLTGGSNNDTLNGDAGVDFVFGQGGIDRCTAENESSCEL